MVQVGTLFIRELDDRVETQRTAVGNLEPVRNAAVSQKIRDRSLSKAKSAKTNLKVFQTLPAPLPSPRILEEWAASQAELTKIGTHGVQATNVLVVDPVNQH